MDRRSFIGSLGRHGNNWGDRYIAAPAAAGAVAKPKGKFPPHHQSRSYDLSTGPARSGSSGIERACSCVDEINAEGDFLAHARCTIRRMKPPASMAM